MNKRYEVPAGFLNRRMLREQANVTEHELKTLEGQTLLKSSGRNNGGWHLYTASDVERVRSLVEEMRERRRPRVSDSDEPARLLPAYKESIVPYTLEQYRAVYTEFEKGTPLDQIPMNVDVHPSILSVILKDTKHLAGAFVVAKPIADAINNLPFRDLGSIRSGDELLKALEKLSDASDADKTTTCPFPDADENPCGKPAKFCLACAKRFAAQSAKKADDEAPAPAPPPARIVGANDRRRRRRESAPRDSGSAPPT